MSTIEQLRAELEEMRRHGDADDATEAAARLERAKHDAASSGDPDAWRCLKHGECFGGECIYDAS